MSRLLTRRNLIALVIASLILIGSAFWLRTYISEKTDIAPPKLGVHYYNNPIVPLDNIAVKIFYVLPSDKSKNVEEGWQETIRDSFKKITLFHSIQFLGRSAMSYSVFPRPVFLPNKGSFYDTPGTFEVNLSSLESIEEDALLKLNSESEAELKKFLKIPPGHYTILFFIYEGNGMGGDRGRAYVSATIIKDSAFKDVKESIMYSNIGHALGFKDHDKKKEEIISDGIMGRGLFRPLEINFIESSILQKMGLLESGL